jgi:hypothetical protein
LSESPQARSFEGVEKAKRYLVEVRRPDAGWSELGAVADRAREAAGRLTRRGRPVQFLRSVYLPEDGTCVFLYEGRSAADVRLAAEGLDIGVDRVAETVLVEPPVQGCAEPEGSVNETAMPVSDNQV